MANPVLNNIPTYVDENKLDLIAKTTIGFKSFDLFNLVTGVVGETALNELTTDVVIQNGATCGFNAQGTSTISRRKIVPGIMKVNDEFCEMNLVNSYMNHEILVGAGKEKLPYEEKFIGGVIDGIDEKMESLVWNADKSSGDYFDGLLTILGKESGYVSGSATASAYADAKDVFLNAPASVKVKDDFKIIMGSHRFDTLAMELVSANLYNYAKDVDAQTRDLILPGTHVHVIGVDGITGDDVIGARTSNLYYGTDLVNDKEEFKFWHSDDDDVFKLKVRWSAGVQVAFVDEITWYK